MTASLAPALPDPALAVPGRHLAPGRKVGHVLTSDWPPQRGGARPAVCGVRSRRWRSLEAAGLVADPCLDCTRRMPGAERPVPVRIAASPSPSRGRAAEVPARVAAVSTTQAERTLARLRFREAWAPR